MNSLTVYLFILVFSHIFILQKMTKYLYHIEIERAQILALHTNGLTQRPIFKELSISKSSIQRAITKFKNEEICGNRKKSARPRKTTSRDDIFMKHTVARSSTSSCKKTRSDLLLKVLILVLVQFHVDSAKNLA